MDAWKHGILLNSSVDQDISPVNKVTVYYMKTLLFHSKNRVWGYDGYHDKWTYVRWS